MKIIGLTGGIGSGKSTVAQVFETLGVPVFKADDYGRKVLESDSQVVGQVKALFGEQVYDKSGRPDRAHIASVVFNDHEKLSALNQIIHPAVAREFHTWYQGLSSDATYCIREAAILFESGSYKDCDQVICVTAPEEVRIDRVMQRDSVNRSQVLERMSRQMPQEEKEERSNFVISNDGREAVIPQVIGIHSKLQGN